MKATKILVVFTLLSIFVMSISAQTPKISWKNLKEKYERFEDVQPIVFNESSVSVFMPKDYLNAINFRHISLLKFDEQQNSWIPNYAVFCGTMTKQEQKRIERDWSAYQLAPFVEKQIKFDGLEWAYLTKSDIGVAGFTELPNYNGTGKYKLKISFSTDRKRYFSSESPEFEVIEKNFTK